ncbi:TPR-like protein [Trichoderma citrinoviride]|uniref:TPR-like protein n=1 Tax=Trichoderma citrinoviride TaxID=58853 RepID=A0A2T4B7L7_9HYPO|nr:TPR-like protein [Trichoderma citrinoviride]PTB65211.1 TPR-like protein [Trichoderma citrinoviride]
MPRLLRPPQEQSDIIPQDGPQYAPGKTETPLDLALKWLSDERNGRWLIILDGANENSLSVIHDFATSVERRNGTILVTTRHKKLAHKIAGNNRAVIEMEPMTVFDAVALLERKLGRTENNSWRGPHSTSDLVKSLGLSPLTICRAAAYIQFMPAPEDFRQLLDSEQEKIKLLEFEPSSPDGSVKTLDSILTIWRTSFDAVRSERSSAAELLSLMSFFDRRGIPKWFLELCRQNDLSLHQEAPSDYDITSDIETLLNHCLISSNGTKDIFSMHGLMQLAVKSCLYHYERDTIEHIFLKSLKDAFPRDIYSNWATCEELFAHAQVAAHYQPPGEHQLRDWTIVLYRAARFARAQGRYEVAMQLANQAANAPSYLGRKSIEWPVISSLIALLLMDQGLYDRAHVLLTHLADVCKDGANRTASMLNLACLHKLKGRWNEAEAILAEVTRDRRTKLGETHPRTLSSMANLASIARAQGRYQEAHSLLLRVFVGYSGSLGPDHPQTLASMNNLGSMYRLLGELDEAERYQKQAHESRKMIFGADHPETLASMNGLASTYRLQGRLDEAKALQEQTLEARKRILGPDHPSTLASMNNLALILNDQGKHGVASKLQSQVLDACKEKLGPEHPHTLTSMNNLALIWRNQDRKSLTRWTMQNCVEARRRVLGPEHPYTVSSARIADSWASEKEKMAGS